MSAPRLIKKIEIMYDLTVKTMYTRKISARILKRENFLLIKNLYRIPIMNPSAPIQIESFIRPLPQKQIDGEYSTANARSFVF